MNQRLDDMPATQHYARLVIDDIDNQALITPLTQSKISNASISAVCMRRSVAAGRSVSILLSACVPGNEHR
ncbi:hypothetical protein ACVXG9_23550 [Escherichia coli]